jgi:hypothetical protein
LRDRPYLLIWDKPTEIALSELAYRENLQRINYRESLLSRVPPDRKFLGLHQYKEREIESLRQLCANCTQTGVLLENFDIFITFLHLPNEPPSYITLFWENLRRLRQLACPLWILLPNSLAPPNWQETQTVRIDHHCETV